MTEHKSLGVMQYPCAAVSSFSGSTSEAEITLTGSGKKLKVKLGISCVSTLVKLAQDITGRQREYAMREWNEYLHMKKVTGYVPTSGD